MIYLDFLIIGGGLTGFASAYTLCQAGHRVRLIENHGLDIVASGLFLSPNATKILRAWLGEEEVERISIYADGSPLVDMYDNHEVGYIYWRPSIMKEIGGDVRTMHYADLRRKLYDLAVSAGARVDLNTSVTALHQGTETNPQPSATLSTGEVVSANVVIGADGPNGVTRKLVVGEETTTQWCTFYTGTAPATEMASDPLLQKLLDSNEVIIWMGSNCTLDGFSLRNRTEYTVRVHSLPGNDDNAQAGAESRDDIVPGESLRFNGALPEIQKLVKMVKQFLRTRLLVRDNSDNSWVDDTGRILLVGDAAFQVMNGGHSAAMALEDAVVLGRLSQRMSSMEQLPMFMRAFQKIREPRRTFVQEIEIGSVVRCSLPPGPAADLRAQNTTKRGDIAEGSDDEDEEVRKEFTEIFAVYGYDAIDAADEWWLEWGRFSERVGSGEAEGTTVAF